MIVFDCDGTLIDSEYPYNKALSDALIREGFEDYTVSVINERFAGRVFHETITIIESEIDRPLSPEFQSYCMELCEDYIARFRKPVDGAADVIGDLHPRYEMGVASNGFRGHVIDSLAFLKLDHIFSDERIFTKCQVARPKPHPDLYHFAAAQMGGEPEKMIAVEDSLPGVQSAVAAGFHVIGFVGVARNPLRMRDVLNQAGAYIIYDDWAAIGDYIRKI